MMSPALFEFSMPGDALDSDPWNKNHSRAAAAPASEAGGKDSLRAEGRASGPLALLLMNQGQSARELAVQVMNVADYGSPSGGVEGFYTLERFKKKGANALRGAEQLLAEQTLSRSGNRGNAKHSPLRWDANPATAP
jgi:hypothetical protein